ncbi:MAG: hypothetical protein ACREJC_03910 [Tepidisphaeraceae bacterium]
MQDDPRLSGAEKELEQALGTLRPAGANVDPLACAFEAGKHSARTGAVMWKATSAALGMALIVVLGLPTAPAPTRNVAVVQVARTENDSAGSYIATRARVLEGGVESLPGAPGGGVAPWPMSGQRL